MPSGDAKSVGSPSKEDRAIAIWRPPLKPRGTLWRIGFSSENDLHQTALRMRGRTPRSWLDRAAIAARSSRDRRAFEAESTPRSPEMLSWRSAARSTPNRCTIRPRSWSIVVDPGEKRGQEMRKSWQKLRPIHGRSRSCDVAPRKRSHDPCKPPPRPPSLPSKSGLILSLKACISLSCSSTFDRLVKKLSEFRGRSLVHRVPPAFRLDCEAIGAGLITNFSLISSNFPLEFRTSTRKNPSKFASIHENWSPILAEIGLVVRFDRLSGGNLSFY